MYIYIYPHVFMHLNGFIIIRFLRQLWNLQFSPFGTETWNFSFAYEVTNPTCGCTTIRPQSQWGLYHVVSSLAVVKIHENPIVGDTTEVIPTVATPSHHLVIQHSYGKFTILSWENSPFLWPFSMAMLVYQRVFHQLAQYI